MEVWGYHDRNGVEAVDAILDVDVIKHRAVHTSGLELHHDIRKADLALVAVVPAKTAKISEAKSILAVG